MNQSDSCGFSSRLRVFGKHCYRVSEFKIFVRVQYWKFWYTVWKKIFFITQILYFSVTPYFFLTIFISNIDRQKITFLYEVCTMGVTSNPVLLIIPFTTMCDMIYKVSYLTRADLITFAEIVFQSSCSSF